MICYQAKGEIKHIRVTNAADGQYSLGKSKNTFGQIWDLIEAQIDQQLKSTKGDTEVQVNMMPLQTASLRTCPALRSTRVARARLEQVFRRNG